MGLERCTLGDLCSKNVVGDAEPLADRGDEPGFGGGCAAQAVVDGRGLDLTGASGSGEEEQREAVGPARNGDPDAGFRRDQ